MVQALNTTRGCNSMQQKQAQPKLKPSRVSKPLDWKTLRSIATGRQRLRLLIILLQCVSIDLCILLVLVLGLGYAGVLILEQGNKVVIVR